MSNFKKEPKDNISNYKDIIIGVFLLFFCFVFYKESFNFRNPGFDPIGTRIFGHVLLIMLSLCSLVLIIKDIYYKYKRYEKFNNFSSVTRKINFNIGFCKIVRALGAISGVALYIGLIEYLGYIISTILFVFLFSFALNKKKHIFTLIQSLVFAIFITILVVYIFTNSLSLFFPKGRWF